MQVILAIPITFFDAGRAARRHELKNPRFKQVLKLPGGSPQIRFHTCAAGRLVASSGRMSVPHVLIFVQVSLPAGVCKDGFQSQFMHYVPISDHLHFADGGVRSQRGNPGREGRRSRDQTREPACQ